MPGEITPSRVLCCDSEVAQLPSVPPYPLPAGAVPTPASPPGHTMPSDTPCDGSAFNALHWVGS